MVTDSAGGKWVILHLLLWLCSEGRLDMEEKKKKKWMIISGMEESGGKERGRRGDGK